MLQRLESGDPISIKIAVKKAQSSLTATKVHKHCFYFNLLAWNCALLLLISLILFQVRGEEYLRSRESLRPSRAT